MADDPALRSDSVCSERRLQGRLKHPFPHEPPAATRSQRHAHMPALTLQYPPTPTTSSLSNTPSLPLPPTLISNTPHSTTLIPPPSLPPPPHSPPLPHSHHTSSLPTTPPHSHHLLTPTTSSPPSNPSLPSTLSPSPPPHSPPTLHSPPHRLLPHTPSITPNHAVSSQPCTTSSHSAKHVNPDSLADVPVQT
ncbi:unnamed protein product [Boreogadus saida]